MGNTLKIRWLGMGPAIIWGMTSLSLAAPQVWDDAGATNIWSTTAANWTGAVTWTNGNNAVFSAVAGETVEVDGTVSAAGLTSNYSALTLSTGYTIADANGDGLLDLSATGGSAATAKPIISASGTNTIGVDILISGTSGTTGGRVITLGSGAALTISGDISESGQSKSLVISNGGTLTLSGNNSFSGGISFSNSSTRLNINNANALGGGAITVGSTISNTTLGNTSGGAIVSATNNALNITTTLGGSSSISNLTYNSDHDLNFGNGVILFGGDAGDARSIAVTGAGKLILNGAITEQDPGKNFFKNGTGTLELGGVASYTGNTTVSAGTLTLTSTSESLFKIQDGGISNRFLGTGTVLFDGILRLDVSGMTDSSGTWNLISVSTLAETYGANFGLEFLNETAFTNLGGGMYSSGGWTFDAGTGDLTLVPEPSTYAMLLGGLGLLAWLRRRSGRMG